MDENTINSASKAQLRASCKQHAIAYGRLDNAGMRAALFKKLSKTDEYVRERLSDPVQVRVVRKVTAPSVLDLLKLISVGDSFSAKEIAKRTGSTEATVRTIICNCNCNSTAPSNARFHGTGMRFEMKRGGDGVRRTE